MLNHPEISLEWFQIPNSRDGFEKHSVGSHTNDYSLCFNLKWKEVVLNRSKFIVSRLFDKIEIQWIYFWFIRCKNRGKWNFINLPHYTHKQNIPGFHTILPPPTVFPPPSFFHFLCWLCLMKKIYWFFGFWNFTEKIWIVHAYR